MCDICNFKVGDVVDWVRWSFVRGQPTKQQRDYWHGEIIKDHGHGEEGGHQGHILSVRWTGSNRFGQEVRTVPGGVLFTPKCPYVSRELCVELERCPGVDSALHSRRNWQQCS